MTNEIDKKELDAWITREPERFDGDGDICICGHNIQDHKSNGTCMIEGCLCAGFEADES